MVSIVKKLNILAVTVSWLLGIIQYAYIRIATIPMVYCVHVVQGTMSVFLAALTCAGSFLWWQRRSEATNWP